MILLCKRSCPILLRLGQQKISTLGSRSILAPFTSTTNPSSNTYYDSQSGMHVAIHNEDEISAFAPAHVLTLEDLESEPNRRNLTQKFQANITSMQKSGFSGIITLANTTTWMTLVTNDVPVTAPEFCIFVPTSPMVEDTTHYPENIHVVFDYIAGSSDNGRLSLTKAISDHVANGTKTTIAIVDHDHDPILTANGVASLIDDTGGGDIVWLGSSNSVFSSSSSKIGSSKTTDSEKKPATVIDPDNIVTLCEELSYLDIPGSTMKSRITVDLDLLSANPTNGEEETMVVDECLMMGINKFVIRRERLKWFREILQRHGKSLRTVQR